MQVLVLTQVLCAVLLAGPFGVETKLTRTRPTGALCDQPFAANKGWRVEWKKYHQYDCESRIDHGNENDIELNDYRYIRDAKRIIGGSTTTRGQFPFVAYLRIRKYVVSEDVLAFARQTGPYWLLRQSLPLKTDSWMCAGTLITEYHVVTAAHCVYTKAELISEEFRVKAEDVQAIVGIHKLDEMYFYPLREGVVTIQVEEIRRHPLYTTAYQSNDIALLTLSWPTGYPNNKVCLPPDGLVLNERGTQVTTLGWGATTVGDQISPVLKKLTSIVKNNPGVFLYTGTSLGTANSGDSGGPVLLEGLGPLPVLVGIVSGPAPTTGGSCLDHTVGQGAIYRNTRVAPFTSWIRSEIPFKMTTTVRDFSSFRLEASCRIVAALQLAALVLKVL